MATVILAMLLFIVALCSTSGASAQTAGLQKNFYAATCPGVEGIVSMAVYAAVLAEPRMGASLLRLHFHDCFVQGCDGSILLDDTATFKGEKTAGPNNNSVRGFEVIDNIKSAVESICPGVVSCADIVTLAARDSVVALGGPTWPVALGRRDSTTASFSSANADLPGAGFNLSQLISKFQKQGLSAKDMIVLSGGHTIGQAQCKNFRAHIYNDTNVDPLLVQQRRQACPFSRGGDSNLAPLDLQTPNCFNNDYFKNLLCRRGLLHSDQELFNGGSADSLVSNYSVNQAAFFADFSASMINMGNINPLTGTQGQIRCNCRRVNSGQ